MSPASQGRAIALNRANLNLYIRIYSAATSSTSKNNLYIQGVFCDTKSPYGPPAGPPAKYGSHTSRFPSTCCSYGESCCTSG
jgi:hypothetical protein